MKNIEIKKTVIDKAIEYVSPTWGANRMKSRYAMALAGAYTGASKGRRQTHSFNPKGGDADSDTLGDLGVLRERSRDLLRNTPVATGAVGTNLVHVVGGGLKMQSRIDRKTLGLTEEEAEEWQRKTEREFNGWAKSLDCDVSRRNNFYDLQKLVLRSTLESGDCFVLLPFKELKTSLYGTRLQIVEADRVCNEKKLRDTKQLSGGIEREKDGTPRFYHIRTQHPGADARISFERKWRKIPAFTKSGRRNVIHVYEQLRPGQTRGVPYLAPVIEQLHQLGKYTEAELMAAVVSSLFTVFLETPTGMGFSPFEPTGETGSATTDKDYKMGAGAVVQLAKDQKVSFANPGRPNTSFDPFVQAILRQIGVALGLPFELLVMHFTKSYSAARSAMLNAWKVFLTRREWLVHHFCNLVFEAWMEEAVLRGRIIAPGFLDDPQKRDAYLSNVWIGPAQGSIDPQREISAVEKRIELGISTRAEETAALTGTDWDQKVDRIKKEAEIMAGVRGKASPGSSSAVIPDKTEKELEDGDEEDDE
ncbi:MAG: phage portal protein [Candidatus Scalindua sp. AMX11]|nr:MAG: phage portal protein [Candidatus Scalindua sp.]NOG83769.1 phage portal protein [Planctomycetota bacterium]RZV82928.1 MAG: phage portal protein [Candidatus Scalindua sp. SCAELEC01]TDE64450.1 MAG: phage portal protein [Candidatus Scalindua sp. AMX11]GJQ59779.1 MAG: hypothetical protein SCALA701_25800 [Candidatus Scalindua sp.]